MIAHTFTCPQGLYFNSITDGCDFRRNVDCEGKDDTEDKKSKKSKFTTTESSIAFDEDENGEEQTVEEILEKIKNAGKTENRQKVIRVNISWLTAQIISLLYLRKNIIRS